MPVQAPACERPVPRAPRAPRVLALAGAALLLLGGCASEPVADPTDAAATTPAPAPTQPTAQTPAVSPPGAPPASQDAPGQEETDVTQPPTDGPGGTPDLLTEQDSGAQVSVTVGQELPLQLGAAWSWAEPVVDGDSVVLTPVDYLVDPGYVEWLVTGVTPGTASVEVVGEPVCGDTTVCPPTTVTLSVQVDEQG